MSHGTVRVKRITDRLLRCINSKLGVTRGARARCGGTLKKRPHLRLRLSTFLFGANGVLSPGLPLPPPRRCWIYKEAVVQTLEVLASCAGQPLKDGLGRRSIGGQPPYLAGWGLERYALAILARWSSPVILRYVAEAPTKSISDDLKSFMIAERMQDLLQHLQKSVKLPRESVSEVSVD